MEIVKYNKIVNRILQEFKENENIIVDAFKTELQEYGHKIDIKYLKGILQNSNDILTIDNIKDLKVAICYSGDISITLSFILFALKNDLEVTLFNERYGVFNTCIIVIIEEILKDLKINNIYFKYDEKYNQKFLIDNQNEYHKIIFIGDYFEYKNLKYYIKREMIYNNFGFIKGYVDKNIYLEEYQKIVKYCYIHNIDMDFYTDKDEFLEEVGEQDKIIILSDDKFETEAADILYNEFPYDNYKFNINEIIKDF